MATRIVLTDTETGALDGKVGDWLSNLFQRQDALDVSTAFAGDVLQTRGASWIEFGSYDTEPFPTLLPAALGFASVLNRGRAGRRAQDNAQIMVSSADAYKWDATFVGPVLMHEPGNNLIEADTPDNRRAALESVRAMVAYASASRRVGQAGWVYKPNANGENWNAESAQAYASGGTIRAGFFSGLQVDIPVTAGTNYLLCHGTDASKARGATIRITQGGKEIASKSLDGLTVVTPNEASNGVSPVVVRLPDLAAGTVTVTVDQAGLAGSLALIDAVLPQASQPRLVILVKPTTLRSEAHNKPELLTYLRSIADTVRAEFGNHVLVVDPEPGWNPATMLGADGLHPNALGTAHVRDAIVTAVRGRALALLATLTNPTTGALAGKTGEWAKSTFGRNVGATFLPGALTNYALSTTAGSPAGFGTLPGVLVPPSGKLAVEFSCWVDASAGTVRLYAGVDSQAAVAIAPAGYVGRVTFHGIVSGYTPGATVTLTPKLWLGGGTGNVIVGGAYGPASISASGLAA